MTRVKTTHGLVRARATANATTDFFGTATYCQRRGCSAEPRVIIVETNWDARENNVRMVCPTHADELLDGFAQAGFPEVPISSDHIRKGEGT